MKNSGSSLFEPIDPFRKHDILRTELFYSEGYTLSIRPLWLTGDLKIMYRWANDLQGRHNGTMEPGSSGRITYYKDLLESGTAQSFMIERDNKPVCQFDLLPAQEDDFQWYWNTRSGDYLLHYLLPGERQDESVFRNSLSLMLRYYFSFDSTEQLFLPVPEGESRTNLAAMLAGFKLLADYSVDKLTMNLYEARREEFVTNE